ncbi:Protein of unknown function [Cotesia congregata]|uniref:Uncharacterized protein n=1 Tax=Cotesia congregata TaxID=51543 RepID=A0A8J2H0E8_COTCN|nr:Protein of unknown function [Cotesia congregata]
MFKEEDPDVRRSDRLATKCNSANLKLPNYNTSCYEHFFVVSAIRLWDELSQDIINSLSLDTFKRSAFEYRMSREMGDKK